MLRSIKNLKGRTIQALDGQIGCIADLYFDDALWQVRYLVAKTGHWLCGRELVIAQNFLGKPQGGAPIFPVFLDKKQIGEHTERHSLADQGQTDKIVSPQETRLRSVVRMLGFQIRAAKRADVGELEDFIADDDTWRIRYLVVDTSEWLGRKVLLAPEWGRKVDWEKEQMEFRFSRLTIENSPVCHSGILSREYEAKLHEHYGQSKYWTGH